MDVRDMARSAWSRIRSKQQIIRDFAFENYIGKISLLKILEISEPLKRCYEGRQVVLAEAGYFWLQLAIHGSHAWFTGFAPASDPQIAVTVLIEGRGMGSSYAVPVAGLIFDAYFE